MRKLSLVAIAVALSFGAGHTSDAQTATLLGTVMRDTLGHAMGGGVEVRIPQLSGLATTNYLGEFRITRIPPGKYLVAIRLVGFEPLSDSITFVANQAVTREFVLNPIPTKLDPVHTRAAEERKYVSPALNGFEERRLSGKGGYFIADSLLRLNESTTLPNVLGRIPGLQKVFHGDSIFMSSSRSGGGGGLVFQKSNNTPCFVTVYMDGVLAWQGPVASTIAPPVNFNAINVSDLAGVEYYPGSAPLPIQYSNASTCGVLLLWTRER